jgi:tRNA wybutosine-synthesizing protein 1
VISTWHAHRPLIISICVFALLSLRYLRLHLLQRKKHVNSVPTELSIDNSIRWENSKVKALTLENFVEEQSNPSRKKVPGAVTPTPNQKRPRVSPKRVTGSVTEKRANPSSSRETNIQPLVFFSSLAGSTERYAAKAVKILHSFLEKQSPVILDPQLHDLSYIEYDDFFVTPPKPEPRASGLKYFYIILLPTYNIDTVLNNFLIHLQETHHDFRIDTSPLSGLSGYSVFGFGDKEGWKTEVEGFCSQAIEVDKWMAKLTARKRAFPLGLGDVKADVDARLEEWCHGVGKALMDIAAEGGLGEGVWGSGDPLESGEEDLEDDGEEAQAETAVDLKGVDGKASKKRRLQNTSGIGDLEDLGKQVQPAVTGPSNTASPPTSIPIDFTTYGTKVINPPGPQEMVPISSPTHAALTKQGYSIIGSHSGVKICRWTKSALRGRGSCYKYSFYGIKSHLCMETTPSLSCSNKCVFCWRHGTNPVGTTWRWKIDPPELIFTGAKEAHLQKIRMMRGVPGVRAERFQEAMRIKHCALSLVGEPIFYPHINEFIGLLHADKISSFLVCNAQHPDHLQALTVVTQLYVSIDASNRESLRKIDRPLHRDFWERFLRCLDILRDKRFRMRTVFRLTLVKGFNIEDEVEGYADLVERGLPCFVEVKGVTYCGTSTSGGGAGLTMQNVPFYKEVTAFVRALHQALEARGLGYGIAAEHAHSCCVLLASNRFLLDGQWHTVIDYDKFFELLDGGEGFAPEDYVGPATPRWATWGQGGFDPVDERFYRKGKKPAEVG